MDNIHVSIIIPVYQCCASLHELHNRLLKALSEITEDFEIIMVNDGSPDQSWDAIKELTQKNHRIRGINLTRNFGQHYAITAGLELSQGEWIIVMDCDLQDQPEEIIKLYTKAIEGYEIVFGQRNDRQDSCLKKVSSKLFYKLLGYLTDTEQDASIANFGIYHRKTINAVLMMKDQIKYFPVMIRWVGFTSCAIEIKHSARETGRSSYSLSKLLDLAINVMISFSDKPLKIAVKMGFFMSLLSFIITIFILAKAISSGFTIPGWASTIISLWFLAGLLIMLLGIVGIYIGKTFDQTKNRPLYLVKEIL